MPAPTAHRTVLDFAVDLPGAWEDHPWGDTVVKVGKKIFVFLGNDDGPEAEMSVKLDESLEQALAAPGAVPTAYGLGKSGWVSLPLSAVPLEVALDWLEESYRRVATKKLVAELDARPD